MPDSSIIHKLYEKIRGSGLLSWRQRRAESKTEPNVDIKLNQKLESDEATKSNPSVLTTSKHLTHSREPHESNLKSQQERNNQDAPGTQVPIRTPIVRYPQKSSTQLPTSRTPSRSGSSSFAKRIEEIIKRERLAANPQAAKTNTPTQNVSLLCPSIGELANKNARGDKTCNTNSPRTKDVKNQHSSARTIQGQPISVNSEREVHVTLNERLSTENNKRPKEAKRPIDAEMSVSKVGNNKVLMSNTALRIYPSQSPETSGDEGEGTQAHPLGLEEASTNHNIQKLDEGTLQIANSKENFGQTKRAQKKKKRTKSYVVPNINSFMLSENPKEKYLVVKTHKKSPHMRSSFQNSVTDENSAEGYDTESKSVTPANSNISGDDENSKKTSEDSAKTSKERGVLVNELKQDGKDGNSLCKIQNSHSTPQLLSRITRSQTSQAKKEEVHGTLEKPSQLTELEQNCYWGRSRMSINCIINNDSYSCTGNPGIDELGRGECTISRKQSLETENQSEANDASTQVAITRKSKINKKRRNAEQRKLARKQRKIPPSPEDDNAPVAESKLDTESAKTTPKKIVYSKKTTDLDIDPRDYDLSDTSTVPSVHSSPVSTPKRRRRNRT